MNTYGGERWLPATLFFPTQPPNVETFERFMEQHPDATHREVWDAAYAAGGQLVHTLLTGE